MKICQSVETSTTTLTIVIICHIYVEYSINNMQSETDQSLLAVVLEACLTRKPAKARVANVSTYDFKMTTLWEEYICFIGYLIRYNSFILFHSQIQLRISSLGSQILLLG